MGKKTYHSAQKAYELSEEEMLNITRTYVGMVLESFLTKSHQNAEILSESFVHEAIHLVKGATLDELMVLATVFAVLHENTLEGDIEMSPLNVVVHVARVEHKPTVD